MIYYRKLAVAIAGVVAAVGTALADWSIDAQEWGIIAGALALTYGVYKVRNEPLPAQDLDDPDRPVVP